MKVKRFEDAEPFEAPNHTGFAGLRLQGFEDGGPENQWVGLSQFLPGGSAGPDSAPIEKVYVVLEGALTVEWDGQSVTLGPLDSCTVPPNTVRRVQNYGNHTCKMLVVMPYTDGAR